MEGVFESGGERGKGKFGGEGVRVWVGDMDQRPAGAAVAVEWVGTWDVAVEDEFGGCEVMMGMAVGILGMRLRLWTLGGTGRGTVGGVGDENVEAMVVVVIKVVGSGKVAIVGGEAGRRGLGPCIFWVGREGRRRGGVV